MTTSTSPPGDWEAIEWRAKWSPHADWTDRTRQRRYDARPVVAMFATIEACASAFHTEVRTVHRWLEGGIGVGLADELAKALGVHPNDVWPTWFDDALFDTDGYHHRRRKNQPLEDQMTFGDALND